MKRLFPLAAAAAAMSLPAAGADPEAGGRLAATCQACHGSNGVSVAADIPNLAAQKPAYIVKQLQAFKDKSRDNPLMHAIAAQLSDTQMEDVAAYYAAQAGAGDGDATSELPADMTQTKVTFPEDYQHSFTPYTTIDFENRKQVRTYLANEVALEAARAGEPMPEGAMILVEIYKAKLDEEGNPVTTADGAYEKDALQAYTAMATGKGWGEQFSELLRNGDWQYAVFKADGSLNAAVSQGGCLACHKPLEETSYLFTLEQLREKAAGG